MPERTFSEEEIARILKRASELELERGSARGHSGLTLDELSSIASESGLDPDLVKRAADELSQPASKKFTGKKRGVLEETVYGERWLDFIPNQQNIDTIIADLDHRFRSGSSEFWHLFGKPKTKKNGKIIEWYHKDTWGYFETDVLMQPVGKKYRIRMNKRNGSGMSWDGEYYMYYWMAAFFMSAGLITSGYFLDYLWQGIAISAVLFSILFPQIKKLSDARKQKHLDKIDDVLDDMITHFEMSK